MTQENMITRSFRIGENTNEKIKKLQAVIGGNQDEIIKTLIDAYECERAKLKTPNTAQVNEFEGIMRVLENLYITALDASTVAKTAAQAELKTEMDAKDKVICELQVRCEKAEGEHDNLVNEVKILTEKLSDVQNRYDESKENADLLRMENADLKKKLTDAEKEKTSVAGLNTSLKEQIGKLAADRDRDEDLIRELKKSVQKASDELEVANNLIETNDVVFKNRITQIEKEISDKLTVEYERKLMELEKSCEDKRKNDILSLVEQVEEYRNKYIQLLESQTKTE